ncbi:MAG: 4a-hydroxytetrahydrobiopterin dehydratase [Pseudomonadota bacterium]
MSAIDTATALAQRQCRPRTAALDAPSAAALLAQLPEWRIADGALCRSFRFANYYQTIAFVNALAYMTHAQDHHPELTITYHLCALRYQTHSAGGGLSDNDFICAAKADALYAGAAVRP